VVQALLQASAFKAGHCVKFLVGEGVSRDNCFGNIVAIYLAPTLRVDYRLRTGNHAYVFRSVARDGMLFASWTSGAVENVVKNMVGIVEYKQMDDACLAGRSVMLCVINTIETGRFYAR
tara:strand:- start:2007 stop:2363 length:357 start_codon:yes stop_codon:yes gene_type:complete